MGISSRYTLLSIGIEEDGLDRRTVEEALDDLTLDAEPDGGASEADSAKVESQAAEATTAAPKRTATRKPPTRKTGGSRSSSSNGARSSSNGSGAGKAKPDAKPASEAAVADVKAESPRPADPEPADTEPADTGSPSAQHDDAPAATAGTATAGTAAAEEPSADTTSESESSDPADKPAEQAEPESPTAVIPMSADDIWAPRVGKSAVDSPSPLEEGWRTVKPSDRPRGNAFDVDDAFSAPPMPPDQTVRTSPYTSSKPSPAPAMAAASSATAVDEPAPTRSPAFPRPGTGARPAPARKPKASVRRSTARQAHLTISRVEPWSVMKFSFAVSVVAFIVLFVAVAVLFAVLSALGVFDSLQHLVNSVTSSQSSSGYNVKKWFTASRILGYTVLLGGVNIVLITAMSTIGAVVYNLTSRLIGGVEVTLKETD